MAFQADKACLRCMLRGSQLSSTMRPIKKPQGARHFASGSPLHSYITNSKAEFESAQKYCIELLQKYDRPSYTLSTFIPRHTLNFYIALRALNVSLSLIPDSTSNPTIGLMRLQFWRDTITKTLAGTPPKEPIAILLAHSLSSLDARTKGKARISKGWLTRLINAREQPLTNTPYTNIAALDQYAENTYSTLLYLTLSVLPLTSLTVDHLASHIGKAAGITSILRGLPLVAFPPPPNHHSNQDPLGGPGGSTRQGHITLPLDVMAQTRLKEEDVFRQGADAPGLRDAVFAVATRASDHLITARQMLQNLRAGKDVGHDFEHEGEEGHEYYGHEPAADGADSKMSNLAVQLQDVERGFGVLMPAVSTQLWLDKLQKVDFDIFKPELLSTDWKLPWKAYLAFQRRKF
ncbi:hypothetical protein D8B26_007700 [Coccidioides posadasii str. Silveira]|uniref:Uncharacterized protein n=1 Tax=Coccidioides posadasii (strain RMSCC 757 / Silveira) TaxID=443226 RepID=E9D2R1_COCPS|nr:conserved hypothetical protein [Coccidioides posadasii str. Silveira]QVM13085.1 hypothetical protein D8B26_007700 [Coccidioides posadasii str. Silveira]